MGVSWPQAEEYLTVLRERGLEALRSYETPELSWEEFKFLTSPKERKLIESGTAGDVKDEEGASEMSHRGIEEAPASRSAPGDLDGQHGQTNGDSNKQVTSAALPGSCAEVAFERSCAQSEMGAPLMTRREVVSKLASAAEMTSRGSRPRDPN
eukprot:evm.model.scf_919EXC.1 EVM.evm.TU.scf_919EXC.1   scf_919EXC:9456-11828(-)